MKILSLASLYAASRSSIVSSRLPRPLPLLPPALLPPALAASSSPPPAAPVADEADDPVACARGRILKTCWRMGTAGEAEAEAVEGRCEDEDEADKGDDVGDAGVGGISDGSLDWGEDSTSGDAWKVMLVYL